MAPLSAPARSAAPTITEPVVAAHPDGRARARPFVKWVGGKRALVSTIIDRFPEREIGTYWEPFVGGGAVFFALDGRVESAVLSDTNHDLMTTYEVVRDELGALLSELRTMSSRHCEDYYLTIRRQTVLQDPVAVAARFIYLNKTCFNGLYRVNRKNEFNVPMGSYVNPLICDEDNLRAASEVLAKAEIGKWSFEMISPGCGDLVYCDPPYDDTFTGYTTNGFDASDQKSLRDACLEWQRAGAKVIVSNSDTPFIRSLYGEGFAVHNVNGRRSVSCKSTSRGSTPELLIVA